MNRFPITRAGNQNGWKKTKNKMKQKKQTQTRFYFTFLASSSNKKNNLITHKAYERTNQIETQIQTQTKKTYIHLLFWKWNIWCYSFVFLLFFLFSLLKFFFLLCLLCILGFHSHFYYFVHCVIIRCYFSLFHFLFIATHPLVGK